MHVADHENFRQDSKTILVTGGAGFLGSHLCKQFLEEGHRVVCLDNFSSGSRRNVNELASMPGFTLLEQDVVEPLGEALRFDEIYNMACIASPGRYQAAPLQTLRTSVTGVDNLLTLATSQGSRIFQASTSEVYGNPLAHPQREEDCGNVNPIGIRACYDEGKRCAETLCMDFHRVHDVDVKVARIFNTYGPRMLPGDGRVVSNFIVQALQNQPITIYGNGEQTRSFCYVDDLIRGIRLLMATPTTVVGPINLGNPMEITVGELAEKIVDLTGSASTITYRPLPQDDPVRRRPDISRARDILSWEPQVKLEQGLSQTIAYFHALLSETGLAAVLDHRRSPARGQGAPAMIGSRVAQGR